MNKAWLHFQNLEEIMTSSHLVYNTFCVSNQEKISKELKKEIKKREGWSEREEEEESNQRERERCSKSMDSLSFFLFFS